MLADPALEARAVELGRELRCVTCQSENINESGASMAADMRRLIRDYLSQGLSDDAVRAKVRGQYGDYILFRPPVQANTYLLWGMPFVLLLGGGLIVWRLTRQKRG
jgi:cytochrome c-type biogenesis protein CcmH